MLVCMNWLFSIPDSLGGWEKSWCITTPLNEGMSTTSQNKLLDSILYTILNYKLYSDLVIYLYMYIYTYYITEICIFIYSQYFATHWIDIISWLILTYLSGVSNLLCIKQLYSTSFMSQQSTKISFIELTSNAWNLLLRFLSLMDDMLEKISISKWCCHVQQTPLFSEASNAATVTTLLINFPHISCI